MPGEPGAYATCNNIQIWFRDEGPETGEPILLIMGLGSQLIAWPQDFVDDLTGRGYRVIRFDNRDSGLSEKIESADAAGTDATLNAVYQLTDMAADTVGLLDHLGIDRAHIVGASMGGMIAQTIAIHHPERVRTLCSIMSTTGAPFIGLPTLEAAAAVLAETPAEREAAIAHIANVMRIIGSRTLESEEREARLAGATAAYDRMFYPAGTKRQFGAIAAAPNRTAALGEFAEREIPVLVVHGGEDSLINISGGRATHNAIPGSELLVLDTMGHDLPQSLRPRVLDAIDANARKALAVA
ncbi:alpha/beta hydrolase [Catellatospora sp. TT07R-123]|uniref:alpha/beta fold hydrolase n=1 Tax=Catellatospora sp. TT07R-123 TaxID=2733863 RepID=UPI001B042A1B|nr:alpha/beta hydrolase [Catellatospora sp. TT07R-123]GHJ48258.1 alpha/beta hydrolase [Catellatospora sp. TT07R-123]